MERIKRLASNKLESRSHHTYKAMSCTIRIALKVLTKMAIRAHLIRSTETMAKSHVPTSNHVEGPLWGLVEAVH